MTKTIPPVSPLGENTVVTLTIPVAVHEPKYQEVLQKVAGRMTLPGFRKGKAPVALVEAQVGPAALLNEVLEAVIPDIYSKAIADQKLTPLVYPQVKIVSVEPKQDWVVEAHTAIEPTVTLGDWEKLVKKAGADYKKGEKDHTHDADHPHDHDQELLSKVFSTLIEAINPKIPPLLLEHEVKHQIEDFARQLASHKMELEVYLKSTGKSIDSLQEDYTLSSLANLQIEFILRAITDIIKPEVTKY